MATSFLRDIIIGPPLPTARMGHERLDNLRALAALSPDALASIAYANQEIFLGLVVAGAAGLAYSGTIVLAIAGLLVVLAISYSQTINAYPTGGGSYTVARENLGANVGLVAAAALLTDYILNVAVSVTAGVAAAASAFPGLWPYRTVLSLVLLVIITLANLRGLRESGAVMTVPVYLFAGTYIFMIVVGGIRILLGEPAGSYLATAPAPLAEYAGAVPLILILHTFAAGCTALTGVEAMSNGVPVFRPPESKHANQTMAVMAALMAILFLGTSGLTQYFAVIPAAEETILSALAHRIFLGWPGIVYYVIQAATLLVLMVAANTSFMDFPRVASILAHDGYMPRQLAQVGDRLVFTNGIMTLAGLAAVLVVVFQGDTHLLIPLFAIGAFLAFTLSQAGMVRHWIRERGRGWMLKAAVNGLGTLFTLAALSIITISKFPEGAWIVVLLMPAQIFLFRAIHQHYKEVREQLTLYVGLPPDLKVLPEPRVVLPIGGVHRGIIQAVRYASSISKHVKAVYIEIDPGSSEQIRQRWDDWGLEDDAELVIVQSPYRSIVEPFIEFLDKTDHEANDGQLATVLLPEFVTAHWWEQVLHNQTAWLIKFTLLYRRHMIGRIRAIIDVPMFLRDLPPNHHEEK